jgi:hypothetical protein
VGGGGKECDQGHYCYEVIKKKIQPDIRAIQE